MKSDQACASEFESLTPPEQEKVEAYRQIPLSSALAFYREFEEIKRSRKENVSHLEKIAEGIKKDATENNERLLSAIKFTLQETQKSTLAMIEMMSRRIDDHEKRIGELFVDREDIHGKLKNINDELDSIREMIGVGA